MQQDLQPSQSPSFERTESGGFAVPGSLHDLLAQHGVDAGADSRMHFKRKPAEAIGVASLVLAGSGFCQGVSMAFADGWSPLPTAVAVVMGVVMAAASLRLSSVAQEDTGTEIVASLATCIGLVLAYSAIPSDGPVGLHIQQAIAYAFLAVSLVVVAAGLIQRHGILGTWSRSAAPVAALAATLAAMT